MLKTNSKKAIENIRQYIINGVTVDDYFEYNEPNNFTEAAKIIYDCFTKTHWNCAEDYKFYKTEFNAFEYWATGLPPIFDTCYYYNRLAANDLAAILEETEDEKAKYPESEAEKLLTKLIYREIKKEIEKC